MKCDPAVAASATWLALLAAMRARPGTVDLSRPSAAPATAVEAPNECRTGIDVEWKLSCGREVDILTGNSPSDLFAIAALFQAANRLACPAGEYPIKMIVGGGGYKADVSRRLLLEYLADLRRSNIAPSEAYFNPSTQLLQGPLLADVSYARDSRAAGVWRGEFDDWAAAGPAGDSSSKTAKVDLGPERVSPAAVASLAKSVSVLSKQKAPIIVALRAPVEFTVLWVEADLHNKFNLSAEQLHIEYRQAVEMALYYDNPDFYHEIQGTVDVLRRARVAAYVGRSEFASMGDFLAGYILQSTAVQPALADSIVRALERDFVNYPRQFLLVDRATLLSSADALRHQLFTVLSQPEVFGAVRATAAAGRLMAYVAAWNRPILDKAVGRVLDQLNHRLAGGRFRNEFEAIRIEATNIANQATTGGIVAESLGKWQNSVWRLQRSIRSFLSRSSGPDKHGGFLLSHLGWTKQAVASIGTWANWAVVTTSYVRVSSLLLPLCLEAGPNTVTTSFQQVRYGGKDGQGKHQWPMASFSDSRIWLTVADASDVADSNGESLRQGQLKAELGKTYAAAFETPP